MRTLANFAKEKNEANLTQEAFAERAGVALTVAGKIEQRKENLNLGKVNQVLKMFGQYFSTSQYKRTIKNRQSY